MFIFNNAMAGRQEPTSQKSQICSFSHFGFLDISSATALLSFLLCFPLSLSEHLDMLPASVWPSALLDEAEVLHVIENSARQTTNALSLSPTTVPRILLLVVLSKNE